MGWYVHNSTRIDGVSLVDLSRYSLASTFCSAGLRWSCNKDKVASALTDIAKNTARF